MQERDRELLTAFVDGEISRRDHKAVLKLLNSSSEARALLWHLRENAIALQTLPARKLPPEVASRIMDSIQHAAVNTPPTPVRITRSRAGKILARFAMAAGLLLAVGGAVFYVIRQTADHGVQPTPQVAENNEPSNETNQAAPIATEPFPVAKPAGYFAFRELKGKEELKRLAKELTRRAGGRVELTVRNSAKAVKALRAIFQKSGIRLIADASAQASMKASGANEYWIFAENSSPDELASLLGRMDGDENFDAVQVGGMTVADRTVLTSVMGIDDENLQNPREPLKLLNPIIEKSKEPKTAKTPAPQVKAPDRVGLIVVANAGRGAQPSPQIQSFLNQRRQLQPGTVQVLFVVRQI